MTITTHKTWINKLILTLFYNSRDQKRLGWIHGTIQPLINLIIIITDILHPWSTLEFNQSSPTSNLGIIYFQVLSNISICVLWVANQALNSIRACRLQCFFFWWINQNMKCKKIVVFGVFNWQTSEKNTKKIARFLYLVPQ
jgi:formate-dependent nitrite reductase membrane component NrfD